MVLRNKNYILLCIILLTLLAGILLVGSSQNKSGFIIDGDSVYWEVSGNYRLEATPHTVYGDKCQILELTNLGAERTIDIATRFNVSNGVIPKSIHNYNPHNVTVEYTKICNGSYGLIDASNGWCNDTVYYANGSVSGGYWEHDFVSYDVQDYGVDLNYEREHIEYWNDLSAQINHIDYNGYRIHYITDVLMEEDSSKKVKLCFNQNSNFTSKTKYDIFMKLSSDTLQEAFDNDRYVMLDPWYDIEDNLIIYYKLDNDYTDETGQYDGTNHGTTFTTDGVYNQAASFEYDDDDYIDPGITFNNTNTSISCWVRAQSTGETEQFFTYESDGKVFALLIETDGNICGQTYDGSNSFICSSMNVYGTTWYHVVYMSDTITDNYKLYINAVLNASDTTDITAFEVTPFLGARNTGAGNNNHINGSIDEFMLFNRSLTETEITNLYTCNELSCNTAPNMSDLAVNVTDVYREDFVNFSVIYYDDNDDAGTVYMNLTVNDVYVSSQSFSVAGNGTSVSWIINPDNWSEPGDRLSFQTNANDGTELGTAAYLNKTVKDYIPTHTRPILNATSSNNFTIDNLTVFNQSTADGDGDSVKNIYNWYVDGESITLLNMPFEGGSNSSTKDYSGLGNNGTSVVVGWDENGGYDEKGAYEFTSSSEGITTELNTFDYEEITFSARAKSNSLSSSYERTILGNNGSQIKYLHQGSEIGYVICSFSNSSLTVEPDYEVVSGVWNHFVCVKNQTNVNLYVNGIIVNSSDLSGSLQTSNNINIGYTQYGYSGYIDEVMIFNRSLSADQIYALYQNETNKIVSQETNVNEVWSVNVTPNDGYSDGETLNSGDLTIENSPPNMSNLFINVTTVLATNDVNFTAYWYDNDSEGGTAYFNLTNTTTNKAEQGLTVTNDGDTVSWVVDSGNFTANEQISFQVTGFDGTDLGNLAYLNYTVAGNAPNVTLLNINDTTIYNDTYINFSGIYNSEDDLAGQVYFNLTVDDVYSAGNNFTVAGNNTAWSFVVNPSNWTKNQELSFQVYANDGLQNSDTAYLNSTVLNYIPYIESFAINVTTVYNDSWVNVSAYYRDADGNDNGTVFFNLTVNGIYNSSLGFAVTEDNQRVSWLVSPDNYTIDDELNFSIYAYDYDDYSNVSTIVKNVFLLVTEASGGGGSGIKDEEIEENVTEIQISELFEGSVPFMLYYSEDKIKFTYSFVVTDVPDYCISQNDELKCIVDNNVITIEKDLSVRNFLWDIKKEKITLVYGDIGDKYSLRIPQINLGVYVPVSNLLMDKIFSSFTLEKEFWNNIFALNEDKNIKGIRLFIPFLLILTFLAIPKIQRKRMFNKIKKAIKRNKK